MDQTSILIEQFSNFRMAQSLNETRQQVTVVDVSIKTNIQYKMMNTPTMIPCRHIAYRDLAIDNHSVKGIFSH